MPKWNKLVEKEIKHAKLLTGDKCGKWLVSDRRKDFIYSNNPVTTLSRVGPTILSFHS